MEVGKQKQLYLGLHGRAGFNPIKKVKVDCKDGGDWRRHRCQQGWAKSRV